ncbi:MAG: bifunctional diaminohydroxyphosphoribosylaminopyrimidine deaminase/5-amino-6-(5-phosphoribosylamino)uracil reductase RibD [Verrucomicrobiales bacterium]
MKEDEKWMRRALAEARKGLGLTSPNPAVGAVIVRDGKELVSGWHRACGRPHAEREALEALRLRGGDARGATIYVTLEPCSTHGRTGACTEALIAAGVARVVYGAGDPNPTHRGAADGLLAAAGIEVSSGCCADECRALIRGFSSFMQRGRPWVIMKTAMSLDGRLTRPPGEGQWLTGPAAREEVQLLRGEVDAIITSGETVRRDDPALTLRSAALPREKKQPWRVVLSQQKARSFAAYRIASDEHAACSLFFPGNELAETLGVLGRDYDCRTVLLEAGGRLNGAFLDAGLVDEMALFYAPIITGGDVPAIGGRGVDAPALAPGLRNPQIRSIGDDLYVRGVLAQAHELNRPVRD